MYPYKTTLPWLTRGAHRHLIDAIQKESGAFRGEQGKILRRRLTTMAVWIRVRAVILVFLSASAVTAAYGYIAPLLDDVEGTQAADAAVDIFARVATTFATGFAILYLLTLRVLDQLRSDVVVSLAIQASQGRIHQ